MSNAWLAGERRAFWHITSRHPISWRETRIVWDPREIYFENQNLSP